MDAAGASPLLRRRTLSVGAPSFPLFPFHRRIPSANLGFRWRPPEPKAATSSNEPQVRLAPVSTVSPVYSTTHSDRELRTPHSGYHFDGTARVFFEGWYFRVSIPHCRQSFCFMYSVENPAFPEGMGMLERLTYGHRFTGVGAQILGADDKYICQYTPQSKNFWGSKHELMLGNTFIAGNNLAPPSRELPPQV